MLRIGSSRRTPPVPQEGRDLQQGDAARDARLWAEACAHYERALAAAPSLDHIWVQLGHVRKEMGDLGGAGAAYERALALRPDLPDTHLQLGHLLKLAGRLDGAVAAYVRAAQLDSGPNDARAELAALGYSPEGRRAFSIAFERLRELRHAAGGVRVEAAAVLDGIDTSQFLQLAAEDGLRLAYRLHLGCSDSPTAHAGYAEIQAVDGTTLRCRILIPDVAFGAQLLGVLQLGLSYEDTQDLQGDTWLAVSVARVDLQRRYLASFHGGAAGQPG